MKVLFMEVLYVSDTMCPRHLYSYFLIIVIERNGSIHFIQKIIIWYNMAILCTCICRYTASLYLVQVFLVGAAMWHIYCIHSFLWIDYFFFVDKRIVIWTFTGFRGYVREILRAPLTVYLYNITLKLFLKYGGFMQFVQNKGQF